ncbi:type IV pilus biogenesis protein PilM [Salinibacillus xinjiangensis]|uniref:Pilus assembly protein PilM n=1 Tax=Salinibacillus xinjiangensis TaxID=1229268 RepID=A0A6G1X9B7_9BACI|nr:pilus assembly protein PilM [Salinibacillus xinjiangensis]MRG87496.1 hypothetical protein [Salinibacillus xinjiangensis]
MAFIGNKKIANLEIQDYVIRYAEVKSKKNPVVTHIDEHYLPRDIISNGKVKDPEGFLQQLKTCFRKWKLRGKSIRFIVPDSSVIIRTVDVPSDISDEELNGHIYFELGESIHLPFENPVVDAVNLGVEGNQKKVLVVASSEETVDTYYDYFKDERGNPEVADISPLCQYRLYHHYGKTNDRDIYLLVQYNVKYVMVSIFDHHKPVFVQNVEIPYPENTWKAVPIQEENSLTREHLDRGHVYTAFDEIYIEIERILRFFQFTLHGGDKQITNMLVTGDHPYLADLMEQTRERINLPAQLLAPDQLKTIQEIDITPKFYNVIGLAMKEGD